MARLALPRARRSPSARRTELARAGHPAGRTLRDDRIVLTEYKVGRGAVRRDCIPQRVREFGGHLEQHAPSVAVQAGGRIGVDKGQEPQPAGRAQRGASSAVGARGTVSRCFRCGDVEAHPGPGGRCRCGEPLDDRGQCLAAVCPHQAQRDGASSRRGTDCQEGSSTPARGGRSQAGERTTSARKRKRSPRDPLEESGYDRRKVRRQDASHKRHNCLSQGVSQRLTTATPTNGTLCKKQK